MTGGHPFWSVDRGDWVPASGLRVGERLLVSGGTAMVLGLERRGEEPVYNLEVDADHCYRVGEQASPGSRTRCGGPGTTWYF